jgi:hypothetical protein
MGIYDDFVISTFIQGERAQSTHVKKAYQMYTDQQLPSSEAEANKLHGFHGIQAAILMFAWLALKTIAIQTYIGSNEMFIRL